MGKEPSLLQTALQGARAEKIDFIPRIPADLRRPISELDWSELSANFGQEHGIDGSFVGVDRLDRLIAWAAGEPRAHWLMLDVKLAAAEADFVPELLSRLSEQVSAYVDAVLTDDVPRAKRVVGALSGS